MDVHGEAVDVVSRRVRSQIRESSRALRCSASLILRTQRSCLIDATVRADARPAAFDHFRTTFGDVLPSSILLVPAAQSHFVATAAAMK